MRSRFVCKHKLTTAVKIEIIRQMERWKPIKDSPGYFVSDKGRVKSTVPWRGSKSRILKPGDCKGYKQVCIATNGRRTFRYVHQLVLEAFSDEPRCNRGVCHRNDVKSDNRLSNLRWGTHLSNMEDVRRSGSLKGENQSRSKLTNDQVREIRVLLSQGRSQRSLAAEYGLASKSTIGSIARGENWTHV